MDKPALKPADTETLLRLPVGAISPLWLMFAGAATMGAAYFWSRTFFRPTNVEALFKAPEALTEVSVDITETVVETVEAEARIAIDVIETVVATTSEVIDEVVEVAPEPVQEVLAALAPEPVAPDDLTVLTGIGPKLAAALAARGVTRFAQIAAWTDDDIAGFDKELKLMGRIGREAWIAQATRLAH